MLILLSDFVLDRNPSSYAMPRPSRATSRDLYLPKVQVVNAALHIAHVDVEGEEVDGRGSTAREHLEEIRQTFARPAQVGCRRPGIHGCGQVAVGGVVERCCECCRRRRLVRGSIDALGDSM